MVFSDVGHDDWLPEQTTETGNEKKRVRKQEGHCLAVQPQLALLV